MATLPALAEVTDLEDRLGRDLADSGEERRAQAALDDASALVRQEGAQEWVDEDGALTAPDPVVAVVLSASLRVLRNPDGYVSESVGPFTMRRADDQAGGVFLTDAEKAIVRRYRATASGLWTQPVTRNEYKSDTIWVEDSYGSELFPWASAGDIPDYP